MKNSTVKKILESDKSAPFDIEYEPLNKAFKKGENIEYFIGETVVTLIKKLSGFNQIEKEDYADLRGNLEYGISHSFRELSFIEDFVGKDNVDRFVLNYLKFSFDKSEKVDKIGGNKIS
jgi:hypothetical protein